MKVLFVRNLATAVTEELLEKTFAQFGKLERVKKLKDYAFVHFEERDAAVRVGSFCSWILLLPALAGGVEVVVYICVLLYRFCSFRQAMDEMNGKEVGGEEIEIVLAKPPDKKRKERQAARQTTRNSGWAGADV